MEIAISRLSSKGQTVIPEEFREDLKEGDKLLWIKSKDKMIVQKASNMDKQLAEDLEFARRTEEAYKEIERGESTVSTVEEFLKEMKKW